MRLRTPATLLATVAAALAGAPPAAAVEFGVEHFEASVSSTQAGAHADGTTSFTITPDAVGAPSGEVKMVDVDVPPGLVGNPRALAACTAGDLAHLTRQCPRNAIAGVADIYLKDGAFSGEHPVFRIAPPPGVAASFAFIVSNQHVVRIDATLRSDDDYGLRVSVREANASIALIRSTVTLWGVPADHQGPGPRQFFSGDFTSDFAYGGRSYGGPLQGQRVPFLTNPSECGVARITSLSLASWQNPSTYIDAQSEPTTMFGCDKLSFAPAITARPSASEPAAPTGLDVGLSFPYNDDPDGLGTPPLRDAVVTLADGMAINPSAADGLGACRDDELQLKSKAPVRCPLSSRIGSVTATTPVLEETLEGAVYVRSQGPGTAESGDLYRIAIVLENEERGISVRLPGEVSVDRATGRITTRFRDNPQLPVGELEVSINAGARAALTTPETCGAKRIGSRLSAWSGHRIDLVSSFDVRPGANGVPCVGSETERPFAPALSAGTTSPSGGSYSPFVLRLTRPDGHQGVRGMTVELPSGLSGRIAGVPYCPESALAPLAAVTNTPPGTAARELAAPSCPAASLVGRATVGVGVGPSPFYVQTGRAYLAGPYKGAPLSLAIVTPAKAGPFDLGNVLVRSAIHVDDRTAELTVVSDDIPTIVEGIPLKIRDLRVVMNRDRFTLNPSDCSPGQARATVRGEHGRQAELVDRFQASDCAGLKFKPRLAMSLTGKRQVRTGKHPGVKAVVRQTGVGEAGIDKAVVRLPKSLALDPANAQALCEFADGTKPDLENRCPKGSIVGRAKAVTPLLEKPLSGNVYFVKNVRRDPKTGNAIRTLPMIVVALRGQIAINLRGESDTTRNGRLVNTFASVPDAPITRFDLKIDGGSNGILAVTRTRKSRINLCAKPKSHVAETEMDGQNGKRRDFDVRMKPPCAKRATGK